MNNFLLIIPLLLIFNAPSSESGVSAVKASDLKAIAQGSSSDELYIGYNYWFQGGVSVEYNIFGNGTAYYHKSVHSKAYQDAINEAHRKGVRISPYQWSLTRCEYGDYDVYERATLTPDQLKRVIDSIVDSRVLESKNQHGDSTYHGLRILLPGKETLKTSSILNLQPEFSNIATYFSSEIKINVKFENCSAKQYDTSMETSIKAVKLVEVE